MDPYSLLLQKMPKEEIERKISEKIDSMGGFLTREAAIRVIANESGAKSEEKAKLAEISDGTNKAIIVAKLERILPLQEFESGKKMRKIVISDESGERELKLWNEDVNALNKMHAGDLIEINGIYCKNNELSLGYYGEMKVVQHASFAELGALSDLEGTNVNVRGYVETVEGMKEYEREGRKRKMFSFFVSDWKNRAKALIWDDADRGNSLAVGSEIKIENALVKNGELHLNLHSRLLVKKKREGFGGKIEGMEAAGGKLILAIDGKRHEFSREDALGILGAQVADDIMLETVVELKKKYLVGKEIFIEMKEGKMEKATIKN